MTVEPPVMVNAAPRSARRLASVTMKAGTPIHATQKPCHMPMSNPSPIVITQINNGSVVKPNPLTGSTSNAAKTPVKATAEPIDKSMCPGTMTMTMPTARIAVIATWIVSVVKFRGDRNRPSVRTWNTIQTPTRTPTRVRARSCATGIRPRPRIILGNCMKLSRPTNRGRK